MAELVCEKTKLMKWLVVKAYEILVILLQGNTANQKRLGQMNGVDVVLQAVMMYKSRDPKSSDEEEMVENLFDCLRCLLLPLENKELFVKAEGVEMTKKEVEKLESHMMAAFQAIDSTSAEIIKLI